MVFKNPYLLGLIPAAVLLFFWIKARERKTYFRFPSKQLLKDLPSTWKVRFQFMPDVLRLIAQGLTNQEIAAKLVIGEGTVRTHVSNILTKLHLANRTQAALYALREGFASLKN